VLADADRLTRAVTNLLSNAYKFSPAGGPVELTLQQEPGRIGIAVRDTGIGLTAEQLARLGERFYRADGSGNIPGTGLGVSIVREILALHGGTLEVRSTPGAGSVFTAWLPRLEDVAAVVDAA
jgi:signal transduction histidine kinase